MASAREGELLKLLTSAIAAAEKAEGDAAEESRATDALRLLQKIQVTSDILAKTEAGKKVKKLVKHASKGIASSALAVVDAWKECVRIEQRNKQQTKPEVADTVHQKPAVDTKKLEAPQSTSSPASLDNMTPKLSKAPRKCGEATRDKIRVLLAEALSIGASDEVGDPCEMAVQIEEAMFKQVGSK